MFKRLLLICFQLFCTLLIWGQDMHWTQFNANPLYQNPANTGNFQGDLRWTANYRDQWRSVSKTFSTVSVAMDGRLLSFKNLSFGGVFLHDVVGDGALRTLEANLSVSYQFNLSADSTHLLNVGINTGINNRMVNLNAFKYGSQFNGVQFDPSLYSNENFDRSQRTNVNASMGFLYQYLIGDRKKLEIGFATHNLLRPNNGFYDVVVRRPVRYLLHAQMEYPIGIDWDIIPSVQLQFQDKYWEMIWGASARYTLQNRMGNYKAVYFGVWNRPVDAIMLSGGVQFNTLFVGLSYDVNYNKLVPASRTIGSVELALRYTLSRFKPKKINHRICPDYI